MMELRTELTWFGVPGEPVNDTLVMSGVAFTSIYDTGVTFLASLYEDCFLEDSNSPYQYTRRVAHRTLGMAYYGVVTVDAIDS